MILGVPILKHIKVRQLHNLFRDFEGHFEGTHLIKKKYGN